MRVSLPSTSSVSAVIKSDIKSRPARWGMVLVALLLMIDVLSIALWMQFPALNMGETSASASTGNNFAIGTSGRDTAPSPAVLLLIEKLANTGANPVFVSGTKIDRPPFSAQGIVLTLHGDNVQVFEYENQLVARVEGGKFLDHREKSHLYIDGPLVVLYTGSRAKVITALNDSLGMPAL